MAVTLPPSLGNCTTNCSLCLLEICVKVMRVLPVVIICLMPVQLSLGLGPVMLPSGVWALAVIVELVSPPDETRPATGAVGVRRVAVVVHMACGSTELALLIAGEVLVMLWGILLGSFTTITCSPVGAACSSPDSSSPCRGGAAPS
jgi:hypothetical protein